MQQIEIYNLCEVKFTRALGTVEHKINEVLEYQG